MEAVRDAFAVLVKARFPGIPECRLKAMVCFYTSPDYRSPYQAEPGLVGEWRRRIYRLVEAWVRHAMTNYDEILASTGVGGAQNKKAARKAVEPQLEQILKSWRIRKKPAN